MVTNIEKFKSYNRYKNSVNMNFKEMKDWSKNPCSNKASIGRAAVNRNLKLLSKPAKKWNNNDIKESKKTISFNARMKEVKAGKKVKGCNLSKRSISLKNWAFDPNKDNTSKDFSKYPYVYDAIKNEESNSNVGFVKRILDNIKRNKERK